MLQTLEFPEGETNQKMLYLVLQTAEIEHKGMIITLVNKAREYVIPQKLSSYFNLSKSAFKAKISSPPHKAT